MYIFKTHIILYIYSHAHTKHFVRLLISKTFGSFDIKKVMDYGAPLLSSGGQVCTVNIKPLPYLFSLIVEIILKVICALYLRIDVSPYTFLFLQPWI